MTMYDDFDTQIQCEELTEYFPDEEYDPNGRPEDPTEEWEEGDDTAERTNIPSEYDDDDEDWYTRYEDDEDMDDLSDWFKEDGGLTADAYEWLATQDQQNGFC